MGVWIVRLAQGCVVQLSWVENACGTGGGNSTYSLVLKGQHVISVFLAASREKYSPYLCLLGWLPYGKTP